MRKTNHFERTLEYSAVFGETHDTIEGLLSKISRKRLLDAAIFFLGFENKHSKYHDYKQFIEMFFQKENSEFAIFLYERITSISQGSEMKIVIPDQMSSLDLFEFAYNKIDQPEMEVTDEAELEIILFKAYILINEKISKKKEQNWISSTENLPDDTYLIAMTIIMSFSYFDILNYDKRRILVVQFLKSVMLFNFLEKSEQTKELVISFNNYFDCNNWKTYLLRLLPLILSGVNGTSDEFTQIEVEPGENFETACLFIDKLSTKELESISGFDYISLRTNPIHKTQEGQYKIIFDLFAVELLHTGLYFKLHEINSKLPKKLAIKQFRSFYCEHFSENYLLYEIMEIIYQGKYVNYSGKKLKEQFGINAEPDYYIRNGNTVFLFESKDILINAEVKSSFDYYQLEQELKRKLYFEIKSNEKVQNKAVLQLMVNIKKILMKQFEFDSNYKAKNLKIYPIIILHNRQLDVPGLNKLINNWFFKELKKSDIPVTLHPNIRPITIINIDTLIFHQDRFKNKIITLNKVIDKYLLYTVIKKKEQFKSEEDYENRMIKTMYPFSKFLDDYIEDLSIEVKAPDAFLTISNKVLTDAVDLL